MKTNGSAVWQGGIKDGKGVISTRSGALKEYPYGFSSRFGDHLTAHHLWRTVVGAILPESS